MTLQRDYLQLKSNPPLDYQFRELIKLQHEKISQFLINRQKQRQRAVE
jgi:hypothetical protein